jgi:hypothetical protein
MGEDTDKPTPAPHAAEDLATKAADLGKPSLTQREPHHLEAQTIATAATDVGEPAARQRGGRPPELTMEQIADGTRFLRRQPKMSVGAARRKLRKLLGVDEKKNSALYRLIIRPAYRDLPE